MAARAGAVTAVGLSPSIAVVQPFLRPDSHRRETTSNGQSLCTARTAAHVGGV